MIHITTTRYCPISIGVIIKISVLSLCMDVCVCCVQLYSGHQQSYKSIIMNYQTTKLTIRLWFNMIHLG